MGHLYHGYVSHNQGVNPLDPPLVNDKVQEGPSNFSSSAALLLWVRRVLPPHRKVFVPRLFFGDSETRTGRMSWRIFLKRILRLDVM